MLNTALFSQQVLLSLSVTVLSLSLSLTVSHTCLTTNITSPPTNLPSSQQGYPSYPLPVKPEPSSPNPNFQLNPYYLSNGQGIYPPTTMNLNQIDYQGYR